jgi:hypothetical protein
MTNLNEPYVESIDIASQHDAASAVPKRKKRGIDWLLIVLVMGGFLFLTIAIVLGVALLLAPLLGFDLQNLRINYSPLAPILENLNLLQVGLLLLASSLILAFAFYLPARWRVLRKRSLRPEAGCPSCGNARLTRVPLEGGDRLVRWMGIPVGRYYCSSCDWSNLRIRKGANEVAQRDDWPQVITPLQDNGAQLTTSDPPRELYWDHTVDAAANGAHAKWEKRLNDPVDLAAYENSVAIEAVNEAAEADTVSFEINMPDGVNLRANPQRNGAMLDMLENGTRVVFLVEMVSKDGSALPMLKSDDQQSWVLCAFLKK